MANVESFLESPGNWDVPVNNVFADDMFDRLERRMEKAGWNSVRSYWENDFRNRRIVTDFMKDPLLGSKRLVSMPDRITNTINVVGTIDPVCRPTVINMVSFFAGILFFIFYIDVDEILFGVLDEQNCSV